jgi:hypothetical protein
MIARWIVSDADQAPIRGSDNDATGGIRTALAIMTTSPERKCVPRFTLAFGRNASIVEASRMTPSVGPPLPFANDGNTLSDLLTAAQ